jgi:phosphoinositide-3-kinase regulatory subunit 4
LYDSEESVVFEMVKSLTKLLEFKLISKQDAFENLDRLLPLLLHPNTWIREETINYIKFLADPKNEILTSAETYCLVRPKIKKYLNKNEKVY